MSTDVLKGTSRVVSAEGRRYQLTGHAVALLVALYDQMGSGRLSVVQLHDSRIDLLQIAFDELLAAGLVEIGCFGGGVVDIALTDNGMVVSNILQDGFPRGLVPKLWNTRRQPAPVLVSAQSIPDAPVTEVVPFCANTDNPIPVVVLGKGSLEITHEKHIFSQVQEVRSKSVSWAGIRQKIVAACNALVRRLAGKK